MRHDRVHEHTLAPGLLRWTLSHPAKRNALSPDMLAWLQRRAAALSGEVVLLTGEGEPSFCAGFDLDALPEGPAHKNMSEAPDAALIAATAAMRRADATFVAVLHGPVFGAGVELACCCDLRLARDDTRFTVPAARLGVVYHPAGVDLLQRSLGLALTQRLLLLGDTLDAAELLRAGGLHFVHPAAELADAAQRVAERLRSGSPASIRAHRDRLRGLAPARSPGADPDGHKDSYEAARAAAYHSDDYREARAAAREGRPARFTGR